jgi:hypothetical protein
MFGCTTTKMICSNALIFFRNGPKFGPLLQIAVGTVAIHPPLEITFVGAAHPRPPLQMASRPYMVFLGAAHPPAAPINWSRAGAQGRARGTNTETLICPGWETLVVPVSQPGTPGRDKRGSFCPVSGNRDKRC